MEENAFETLQSIVGDNPQALQALDQAKQQFQGVVGKLQEYEGEVAKLKNVNAEVIQSRDKVKNLVRETLGVEELNKDAILEKLSNLDGGKIEAKYQEQFANLKKDFGQKLDEAQAKIAEYESKVKDLQLQMQVAKTEVLGQVQSPKAAEILMAELAKGAEFDEEGNIRYVGSAGETILDENGNPLTLEGRVAQIKQNKDFDFIWQSRFLNGGGAPTNTTGSTPASNGPSTINGAKLARTKMSQEEKEAYVAKYGMENYMKLPLI